MGQYKISRSLEASIVDYLTEELASSWTGVSICKTFSRIYNIELPSVCIRVGVTTHEKAEIGANSTIRTPQVLIDVFATSDGQRLDLKDFLIEKLKGSIPYYNYTISGGVVQSKVQDGRIRITEILDNPINFDTEKDKLDVKDRHRHLLTLSISLGRVEA